MRNGQLKPGYNVQIGTENGFVLSYGIFPNPTDTRTLIPHLETLRARLGILPERVIADAGYGSHENYAYLEKAGVEALAKFATFRKEASRAWKKEANRAENWTFDEDSDRYICPEGRSLPFVREMKEGTKAGYQQMIRLYACDSCEGCGRRAVCCRGTGNRTVQRNKEMLRLRQKARLCLASEQGKTLYRRRAVEVETVFGEIKGNRGFRRFLLRGEKKVSVEWGLLAIGYNIRRMYSAG